VYLDASALVKLYVREPESDEVDRILSVEPDQSTARITLVELRRNLARTLRGSALARARTEFERDWEQLHVIEINDELCDRAAELAELTRLKTLDAIHLAAAERIGGPILTYDVAQARAARGLGLAVIGA
jgi:predicted nucleic acid-binding protein